MVGGGISGSAASYYLQRMLLEKSQPPATICVYEANDRLGGRLKHTSFGGASVEEGGAAWTTGNHHMVELAKAMNMSTESRTSLLEAAIISKIPNVGVWNGSTMTNAVSMAVSEAVSVIRTAAIEAGFLLAVDANYHRQASGAPFTSLDEFVSWGNLDRFTAISVNDYLSARGVGKELIDFGLVPLTRAIYNRNGGANAFATFASLTAELSHHSVSGGNYRLVEALLTNASAHVLLNFSVGQIVQQRPTTAADGQETAPRFAIKANTPPSLRGGSSEHAECGDGASFDAVIIAAPLERTQIDFINVSLPPTASVDRGFTPWYVTLVKAADVNTSVLQKAAGGQSWSCKGNCFVLTTANGSTPAAPYVCLQPLGKHGQYGPGAGGVFMVYSDQSLLPDVERLFVNVTQRLEHHWPYTFAALPPITDPSTQAQPVVLAPGLYNANVLESIASAMEISVIGARNAAGLVVSQLGGGGW